MHGTIEAIFTAPAAGAPMQAHTSVRVTEGSGLEGDRYARGVGYYSDRPTPGGGRELTLIEAEVLEALHEETGIDLAPAESRRNVVTRGIRLGELIGRRFRLGEVVCEGLRICEPCVYLESLTGKPVNEPLVHRGGLRANVVGGGVIQVGDAVEPLSG